MDELPVVDEILSCNLSLDGLREQRERYARLSRDVVGVTRAPHTIAFELAPDFDRALLDKTIAIERECCPFFGIRFEEDVRQLTVRVADAAHTPALDAIAELLGDN